MPITCLILGAGGIGRALAQHIAEQHPQANIVLTYRNNKPNLLQSNIELLQLDATNENNFVQLKIHLEQKLIKIDWLINTIGILHDTGSNLFPEKKLNDIDADNFQSVITNNVLPTIFAAKHLLALFNHTNQSVFVVISAKVGSISDNRLGGWYSYRASKSCLNMIIKNLSIELAMKKRNLCVLALHPGTTDTHLSEPFQKNVPAGKLFSPEQTASYLLAIIEKVTPKDTGSFLSWDGSKIPW